ncbi:hypothetical protein ACL9RF_02435 [Sphingobacterium sp. Mn56C]|uniref:hypothetical protein n=1 Tax=Sphingobacterium sp. Mn56C TaxID=3395261 RepID=UPI003BC8E36D
MNYSFAQQVELKGIVLNSEKEVISGASILLKKGNKIHSFSRTDIRGNYAIKIIESDLKDATLEVNHLSYIQQSIHIIQNQTEYNFILTQKENQIEEISIGKPVPIRQRKDTLSFNVSHFVDSIDRSIGDVLRRMPGFDVSENGKISFNGQDISYFYIDGDDVLGNKYGLGTRNIPHKIITNVDVYRNHQSIKALGDKVNSNQLAINLKVKEDIRAQWIGEVKGGFGTKQYLFESNVLRFNKKLKTINAIMANNSGNDIEIALQNLTQTAPNDIEYYMLQSGSINSTKESNDMFYKNHSLGGFFNFLFKLKKDWTIRSNLGFYIDNRLLKSFTTEKFDLQQNIFETKQSIDLQHKPIKTQVNLNLTRNVDQMYLTNNSTLNLSLHQVNDSIGSTEINLTENLKQKNILFENKFSFIPKNNGGNFWKFDWSTIYRNVPEKLHILADTIIPIISDFEKSYNLNQYLTNRTLSTKSDFYYFLQTTSNFSQNYGFESSYENKKLSSELVTSDHVSNGTSLANFYNDLHWNRFYLGAYGAYQLNIGKLKTNLKLPLGALFTKYSDPSYELNERNSRILFYPYLNIRYAFKPNQNISIEYFSEQKLGKINDVYRSFILTDFRSINSSKAHIPQIFNNRIQTRYNIENPSKMSFWNFSYNFSILKSDVISAYNLNQDAIKIEYISDNNTQYTQEFGIKGGKYIKLFTGTSSFEVKYSANRAEQIFNNRKQKIGTNTLQVYPKVEWKFGNIQGKYFGAFSWSWVEKTNIETPNKGNILNHNASLAYSLKSKLFLTVNGSYLTVSSLNNKNSQALLNSSLRYKFSKKIEYGLNVSNLLNRKNSSLFMMDSGYSFYQENAYRGRMAILSAQINF